MKNDSARNRPAGSTSTTPWNSIAESLVEFGEIQLNQQEALVSPCASCSTAPCCTHLPLHTFKITNLVELDHALYLLNFDRIELGLSAAGDWSVYYCYPCRFLDRASFGCTVHNTPQQPQICVHYNPYHCWYKRVFTRSNSDNFLRIDRQRMAFILDHLLFDEARQLVAVPDWASLTEGLAALPLEPGPPALADPPITDAATETWQTMVSTQDFSQPAESYSYAALQNPCQDCQAYCCQTLVFPQGLPTTISNLDYYRFCLGFPGVELGLADDHWSLLIKTTCRHLVDHRCAIYGQPERPLICKYYDALKCTYRINFGLPRPQGFLRVRLEQFLWLTDCFQFDQHGNIIQFPPLETIRSYIEACWSQELVQATPA
jgi:hypothetical protein